MNTSGSPFGREPTSGRRRNGGASLSPPNSSSPVSAHLVGGGSGEGAAAGHTTPGRADTPDSTPGNPDKDRLKVAFEAISGLASCVDHLVRDLRRGTAPGQWRTVTDELSRIRRMVAARPEAHEGPPRDEGPASQPPSPMP